MTSLGVRSTAALARPLGLALALTAASSLPIQQDDLRAARTKGSPTAPVTMYEMSDFQCPFCGQFARETLPALEREYVATGKVKIVFVNFPLPTLHQNAVPAAELAMCAARQDRFWPMHDLLFRTQRQWQDLAQPGSFFLALGDSAGTDRDQLVDCVRRGVMRNLVRSDAEGSMRSGARSTPTFYIDPGALLITGAQPIGVFRQVLDSIIRARNR